MSSGGDPIDKPRMQARLKEPVGSGEPSPWHWVVAAIVVFLVLYPLGRWMEGPRPEPGQSEVETSYQHYRAGRYQDAIRSAKAAVAANPNLAQAYNNLSISYGALRRFDEGIDAARSALRINPDFQLARNNLAWMEQQQARAAAPRVSAASMASANTLLAQSLEHYKARRFQACMESASKAGQLNPALSQAFINSGICAGNLSLWDDAIKNTEQAIRLDPGSSLARNNLAWLQQQRANSHSQDGRQQ